jgi:hypothetical protein
MRLPRHELVVAPHNKSKPGKFDWNMRISLPGHRHTVRLNVWTKAPDLRFQTFDLPVIILNCTFPANNIYLWYWYGHHYQTHRRSRWGAGKDLVFLGYDKISSVVQLPALQKSVLLHFQGIIRPFILKMKAEKSSKTSVIYQSTQRPFWKNFYSCWLCLHLPQKWCNSLIKLATCRLSGTRGMKLIYERNVVLLRHIEYCVYMTHLS